jgi:cytochrome c-type biogenesis protein CcmH/NrfG
LESPGKLQEALKAYREALKWSPEDEEIQENIRRIERHR